MTTGQRRRLKHQSDICHTPGSLRPDKKPQMLDLQHVFVDRTGAALVQSLLHQGMSMINCSPFVTEQLKQVPPNKDVENGKS
jgi:hypothetical protein